MKRSDDFVELEGIQVIARRGESEDRLIRRFMKKVRESGILREYAKGTYYEKPSIVRRKKRRHVVVS